LSNESGAVLTESKEGTEDSAYAMTMEDYLHYEEEAFKTPNHGDIVDGIVVRVDPDEVLVDIGAKAEGVISSKELGLRGDVDSVGLEPGDQIKVYVLQPENEEGNVVLSLRRARAETTWLVAAEKQTDGSVIDADVREQNKGGLIVNILGLRGFLPSSQVARAYAGSLESLVGQRVPVKILEVNRKRNRLIVSQKAAFDEDRARKREELFSRLQTGTVVKGTVSGITSYGAFCDIGGADGLIHISELSWDRVSKVTDVLQLGDEVTVKVIKLDPEQTRISLSLRQLQQDPWERLVQSMPIGSIVEGPVTQNQKSGAFLQIMAGGKGRTIRGKDNHADIAVMRDSGQCISESLQQSLGEAVAGMRPIERERDDAAIGHIEHGFAHLRTPPLRAPSSASPLTRSAAGTRRSPPTRRAWCVRAYARRTHRG